jgi:hypothetical protein
MGTIQSLALLNLKEEAGHSLVDDVLNMRKKQILNDSQALEMVSSILEIIKARVKRDTGNEIIITTPWKLTGFKFAHELVNEALNKLQ